MMPTACNDLQFCCGTNLNFIHHLVDVQSETMVYQHLLSLASYPDSPAQNRNSYEFQNNFAPSPHPI